MLSPEKHQSPLLGPGIGRDYFQHPPHKLCFHTRYYFTFGVNKFYVLLAHQLNQLMISAVKLHGLLLRYQFPVEVRRPARTICFYLGTFFVVSSLFKDVSRFCL